MTTDRYTHGHSEAVLRSHRWRTAANSAAYLLPHLTEGMSLLDVGCGPGTLTVDLARHVAPGDVLGVDVSAEVVAAAEEHAAAEGATRVRFLTGDFRTTALGRDDFDVVHAHQVLQHLVDPVGALRSMAALARPGGLVAVRESDYAAKAWAPEEPLLRRWLEVYLAVTRRNGAEANAGRHLPIWAAEAGLTDVAYSTSTWTFWTPEDRAWWGELWAERTTSSAFGRQAVEYGIADEAELAAIADAWRRWGSAAHGSFILVHGELVART